MLNTILLKLCMFEKIMISAIIGILVMQLCGCAILNHNNEEPTALTPKINEYLTYEEMINEENNFNLNQILYENKKEVFKIDNLNGTVKFYIGGICYCPLYNDEKPKYCKSDINCPNLKNRELFCEITLEDGNIVTVIYKDCCDTKYNNLEWINSNGGNCYRYEKNYDDKLSYILKDNESNSIVGLKMLYENELIKNHYFKSIKSLFI